MASFRVALVCAFALSASVLLHPVNAKWEASPPAASHDFVEGSPLDTMGSLGVAISVPETKLARKLPPPHSDLEAQVGLSCLAGLPAAFFFNISMPLRLEGISTLPVSDAWAVIGGLLGKREGDSFLAEIVFDGGRPLPLPLAVSTDDFSIHDHDHVFALVEMEEGSTFWRDKIVNGVTMRLGLPLQGGETAYFLFDLEGAGAAIRDIGCLPVRGS